MLISKQWLNDFVDTSKKSDQEIADLITHSTVEVEQIIDQAVVLEGMVVGEVKSLEKHPNADKLTLCQVDVGGRETQIVCGGENLRASMKVAVALPGAKVRWHGEGELIELAKTKIRGEESEGMICASAEIGLDNPEEGDRDILDLGPIEAVAGTPLAETLLMNDIVLEVEHKSLTNRPDLMGHYGIAREIAALTREDLKPCDPAMIDEGSEVSIKVSVKNNILCPRYMAVAVDGVTVGPSPSWMQKRLQACGIRPINNIVDITNYVLLEIGEPMHAFDANLLGGDKVEIGVRTAKKGEKIVCLDEVEYELDDEMLLITDGKKPVAIAGVMGGEKSGVTPETTRIVFEAANFDPVSIRKTSQKLGLRSESSARFEKSLDPALCELALRRAVELTKELCPGAVVSSKVIDEAAKQKTLPEVTFTTEKINTHLGATIEATEIKDILERLGFGVEEDQGAFTVTIPSWRATKDIEIKEDVFEEVARIYGYHNIPSTLPNFRITPPTQDRVRLLSRKAREVLSLEGGAHEVYQYAFVKPETLEGLGWELKDHVKLLNPLASDRPYLVRSLVPNLLETIVKNQRLFEEVRLFQVERVFLKDEKGLESGEGKIHLPNQPRMVCGMYAKKGDQEPFWQAKAMVMQFITSLGYEAELTPAKKPAPWQHPVRQAEIVVEGQVIGALAEIDPERSEVLGADHRISTFEINLDTLATIKEAQVMYEPVATHPSVERDLAFVVEGRVSCKEVQEVVQEASKLLTHCMVFDVYCGKGVEEGKKSLAMHFTFCANDRTLTSEEADREMEEIKAVLEKKIGAIMRA